MGASQINPRPFLELEASFAAKITPFRSMGSIRKVALPTFKILD